MKQNEDIAARIKTLRLDVLGLSSQTKFADAVGGVTRGAVANWEVGKGIKTENLRKIADKFNISFDWLATGKGEPPKNAKILKRADSGIVNRLDTVPVVGTVSAGVFSEGVSLELKDITVPMVPRDDIPIGAQYALLVSGQSVNNKIADGGYAICVHFDQHPGGAKHGSLVHVVRERSGMQEHTIKVLKYTEEGRTLNPTSDHEDHQEPILLGGDEDTNISIKGIVIAAFTNL